MTYPPGPPGQPGAYGQPPQAPPTCYRHGNRQTYVTCVRCERPICPDCMHQASVGYQCPECVRTGTRSVRTARTAFGGTLRGADAMVTKVLIGINLFVYLLTTATGTNPVWPQTVKDTSKLFQRLALVPGGTFQLGPSTVHVDGVATGQYYRLFTSMWVHFGIVHLATNMLALWIIGREVERALGPLRYLLLYVVSGFGGAVASYTFGPHTLFGAGASGAVYGLFGALFILARRIGAQTGPIVGLIAFNLFISFSLHNAIDWRAHVGGLITGGVVGVAMAYAPRQNRSAVQFGASIAIVVLLIVVAAARTSALSG